MAFRKTLEASDWEGGITVTDAYWRLQKSNVMRMLESPTEDGWDGEGDDPRTSYYTCRCTFTIFDGTPNKQGKPFHTMSFDAPLVDVEAQAGDTFIAKIYALLATEDFADAESV